MSHNAVGSESRRNGPSAAWLFIATASGLRPQLSQLATGLRRRPLALGKGPTADDWPGIGLASAMAPAWTGAESRSKNRCNASRTCATGPPKLEGFQDDSPATGRCPAGESRDVGFPAPSASGEFLGRLGQREEGFARRVDHAFLQRKREWFTRRHHLARAARCQFRNRFMNRMTGDDCSTPESHILGVWLSDRWSTARLLPSRPAAS